MISHQGYGNNSRQVCRILKKQAIFGSANAALCRISHIIKKSGSQNRKKSHFRQPSFSLTIFIYSHVPDSMSTPKMRQAMCRI